MADLLCKIPTFYPIPQNRFIVLFPEKTAVDGYVVNKIEFINDKTGFSSTQTLITPKGKETFRLLYVC